MQFMSGDSLSAHSEAVLSEFMADHPHLNPIIKKAEGVLVFPSILKAGLGFGGEYGEGTLFIKGQPKASYNIISVSFGFQMGAQVRTLVMAFMTKEALDQFRSMKGFKVGVDASVAVVTLDAGLGLDTNELTSPVVAFVTDRKGLMYNLSLEGSKISEIA